MAITEYMDEREHRDFDTRLLAPISGPRRPSEGMEQLWGMMGRPGVAPGLGGQRPPAAPPRRPSPTGRKIGEAP